MYKLKFTGDCDKASFESTCAKQEFWYHSYYFDNGFEVAGDYNIGLNIEEYGFPDDMTGMKVLDIGTASGWFAFYFEQLGAEVTAVDARGFCDFDMRGRPGYAPVETEKPEPDDIGPDGAPIYITAISGGFWTMRDLLKSNVRFVNARVYDVCPELFGGQRFDLVFMGSLLLHLRDPVGALMAAHSVCADRLIAATRIMPDEDNSPPRMTLFDPATSDRAAWWRPNKECYRYWFLDAGFKQVDVERAVTLTSDKTTQHPHLPVPRNPTQNLQIGDARVWEEVLEPDRRRFDKRIYRAAGELIVRAGARIRDWGV